MTKKVATNSVKWLPQWAGPVRPDGIGSSDETGRPIGTGQPDGTGFSAGNPVPLPESRAGGLDGGFPSQPSLPYRPSSPSESSAAIRPTAGNAPNHGEAALIAFREAAREASKDKWPYLPPRDFVGELVKAVEKGAWRGRLSREGQADDAAAWRAGEPERAARRIAPDTRSKATVVFDHGQSLKTIARDVERIIGVAMDDGSKPDEPRPLPGTRLEADLLEARRRLSDFGAEGGTLDRPLDRILAVIGPEDRERPVFPTLEELARETAALGRLSEEARASIPDGEPPRTKATRRAIRAGNLAGLVLVNLVRLAKECRSLIETVLLAAKEVCPPESGAVRADITQVPASWLEILEDFEEFGRPEPLDLDFNPRRRLGGDEE